MTFRNFVILYKNDAKKKNDVLQNDIYFSYDATLA